MMTALVATADHVWQQRSVPIPVPGRGQVLVRAAAAAINNADVVALDAADAGSSRQGTGPVVAGYEVAGTVAAVGNGVDEAHLGTRVMASTTQAFAQYVLADHRHTLPVPGGMDMEQAAALPTALLTEHGALRAGGFLPGQAVLVTGATSAIGLVGVQVAQALWAGSVLATTRSAAKTALLRGHGADVVVDTSTGDLVAAVLEATGGEGADLVIDHVGGRLFADALAATRRHGTLVQVGRLDRPDSTVDLDTLAYRRLTVRGVSFGDPDELADLLATAERDVLPAVAAGQVRPVLDQVLPFDRAADAADRVRRRLARGKVVFTVP